MGAGLRISEALSLKTNDIKNDYIVILGKGKKERLIPLIPQVKKVLSEWVLERSKIKEVTVIIYLSILMEKKLLLDTFKNFFIT